MRLPTPLFPLFLLGASPAFAGSLACTADYDEGSRYELTATTGARGVEGKVGFRYVTSDGIDLHAELTPGEQSIEPGKVIRLRAANESMGTAVDASFANGAYEGTLAVTFDVEHAEPVELPLRCTLN